PSVVRLDKKALQSRISPVVTGRLNPNLGTEALWQPRFHLLIGQAGYADIVFHVTRSVAGIAYPFVQIPIGVTEGTWGCFVNTDQSAERGVPRVVSSDFSCGVRIQYGGTVPILADKP